MSSVALRQYLFPLMRRQKMDEVLLQIGGQLTVDDILILLLKAYSPVGQFRVDTSFVPVGYFNFRGNISFLSTRLRVGIIIVCVVVDVVVFVVDVGFAGCERGLVEFEESHFTLESTLAENVKAAAVHMLLLS